MSESTSQTPSSKMNIENSSIHEIVIDTGSTDIEITPEEQENLRKYSARKELIKPLVDSIIPDQKAERVSIIKASILFSLQYFAICSRRLTHSLYPSFCLIGLDKIQTGKVILCSSRLRAQIVSYSSDSIKTCSRKN